MNKEMEQGDYLTAYANGMQFVLLALEGRIEELGRADRGTLNTLMMEYHEMAIRLRGRARGSTPVLP